MPHSLTLTIADLTINLYSESNIVLEEGYLPFLTQKNIRETDITIHCFSGIPAAAFREDQLVFEAKNEVQKFYSIFRSDKDLGFIVYNQQTTDEIQQIAYLDETFLHWKIFSEASSDNSISPLKYPLGPIIMHYLTLTSESVMMHASCAFDGSKSRIFTGFSGAGKSTISKLWSDEGNLIINDDRLIIRKQDKGYFVYNTPMYYKDIPKVAPLSSIYLISHSPQNKIKRLTGALAISKVMAFCIQNNFDRQFIESRLNFFGELCSHIPVYELGFVPDNSVVKFILANGANDVK